MERFQKIVCHETYKQTYEKLQELEKDREFCGHDMEHFLSVARISYLMYEKGISHDEAGAILAEEILKDCGYTAAERKIMVDTILNHRDVEEKEDSFAAIFYRADKLSRDCIHCKARQECYWPQEKKNSRYIY